MGDAMRPPGWEAVGRVGPRVAPPPQSGDGAMGHADEGWRQCEQHRGQPGTMHVTPEALPWTRDLLTPKLPRSARTLPMGLWNATRRWTNGNPTKADFPPEALPRTENPLVSISQRSHWGVGLNTFPQTKVLCPALRYTWAAWTLCFLSHDTPGLSVYLPHSES